MVDEPQDHAPDASSDERWNALEELDEWLRTPMLVLSFLWLLLVVVELVCGAFDALETFGTAIWIAFLVELLAAIPSVVYGLWGIFVLAPFVREHLGWFLQTYLGFIPLFQGRLTGIGMLTGGIILAIMITPIITAVIRDVLEAVPTVQREAALALGATKWETTQIVLSNAASGIAGAIVLGLGRALGETMAVTMVIGNVPQITAKLFEPGYTIASVLAANFAEARDPLYFSALIEIGLILFLVTFVVNALAKLLVVGVTSGAKA